MAKLTYKQQVFVEEFLVCWNATEAARRAGYKGDDNTLGVVGYENLRKPKIAARIKKRLAEKAMAADEVLARLSDQARADLGEFLNIAYGKATIDFSRAEGKTHLLKKVRVDEKGTTIELYDAQSALSLLGKHLGLFVEKVDVTSKGERIGDQYSDAERLALLTALLERARAAAGGSGSE